MRPRIDKSYYADATAAFLLPVLVLLLVIGNAPESFMSSVYAQSADIELLRSRFAGGRLFIPDAILDIITRRFYPSFLICLLIGGNPGRFLLRLFFYMRFGLLGFGMYQFCSVHIKIKRVWSCVIGLFYSLCSVSLVSSMDPQILNVMIAAPFAACAIDNLMRHGGQKESWIAIASFMVFMTGGLNGIISGTLFILSVIWLFSGLIPGGRIWSVIKALIVSLLFDMTVIMPVIVACMPLISIKRELELNTVTFKFFDLLCSSLDGAAVNVPSAGGLSAISLSVFVLMFTVLFFINRVIPHRAKFAGLILIVLLTASCSWSLPGAVLSVYGNSDSASMSRIGILVVLVFIMASVSLRNAGSLTRNGVLGAVFSILILIVLSNVSSASEVTRSMFTIWFSAAAVIFWGAFLSMLLQDKGRSVELFALFAVTGLVLNLFYSFKVSDYSGSWESPAPYRTNSSALSMYTDEPLPLYGSESEYIMVYSDLRPNTEGKSFPVLYNRLVNAVAAQSVFAEADAFPVYTSGLSNHGNGVYAARYPDVDYEVLLRAENLNFDSTYYVFSSFAGTSVLTETYSGIELENELDGPYFKQLGRHGVAVSLRQVGKTPDGDALFTLWRGDAGALETLRSHVMPMQGYQALLGGDGAGVNPGYVTVVTSLVYSDGYDIRITGPEGRISSETFSYAGRLAAAFRSEGNNNYLFEIESSYVIPILSLSLWVLSSFFVVYNIIKRRKEDRVVPNA